MISKPGFLSYFYFYFYFFFVTLLLCSQHAVSQAKNWTYFRGTNLNGIADNEIIPLKWDSSVIKWKTEIHDKGYSSPVVYNNQIWVTTSKPDGKELYAVCYRFSNR